MKENQDERHLPSSSGRHVFFVVFFKLWTICFEFIRQHWVLHHLRPQTWKP